LAHDFRYFPTEFPTDAAQTLIDYLMGKPGIELCCVADCAYGLLGYGLGQLCTHDHPVTFDTPVTGLSNTEKAELLKPLTTAQALPPGINWSSIVLLVMQILQELMQSPVPLATGKTGPN
jgi:hypothetical protein